MEKLSNIKNNFTQFLAYPSKQQNRVSQTNWREEIEKFDYGMVKLIQLVIEALKDGRLTLPELLKILESVIKLLAWNSEDYVEKDKKNRI